MPKQTKQESSSSDEEDSGSDGSDDSDDSDDSGDINAPVGKKAKVMDDDDVEALRTILMKEHIKR